jgi:hypothetical protein
MCGCAIEAGGIEPADRQQHLQGHISAGCLEEPVAIEPVVEPCPDPLDLLGRDEVDLVDDEHVGERHLAELELHRLRGGGDLRRVALVSS